MSARIARDDLAEAILARTDAAARAQLARQAVRQADGVVAEAARDLAGFDGLDEGIGSTVAERLKAFAANPQGPKPSTAPTAAQQERRQAREAARGHLDAMQAAQAILQAELRQAEADTERAQAAVVAAAEGVLVAEGEDLARELEAAEANAKALRTRLLALARVPIMGAGRPAAPVRITPHAVKVLRDSDWAPFRLEFEPACRAATEYLAALLDDPQAQLGEAGPASPPANLITFTPKAGDAAA